MLHAFKLKIKLPGEKELHTFKAPIPKRFIDFFKSMQK